MRATCQRLTDTRRARAHTHTHTHTGGPAANTAGEARQEKEGGGAGGGRLGLDGVGAQAQGLAECCACDGKDSQGGGKLGLFQLHDGRENLSGAALVLAALMFAGNHLPQVAISLSLSRFSVQSLGFRVYGFFSLSLELHRS